MILEIAGVCVLSFLLVYPPLKKRWSEHQLRVQIEAIFNRFSEDESQPERVGKLFKIKQHKGKCWIVIKKGKSGKVEFLDGNDGQFWSRLFTGSKFKSYEKARESLNIHYDI